MPASVSFDASTLINFHGAGSIVLLAHHFRGRAYVASYIEDVELGESASAIVLSGPARCSIV